MAEHRAGDHVLDGAERRQDFHQLKGPRHAALGDSVRRKCRNDFAREPDLARRRLQRAGDQVHHRRLAGTVRPDQAHELALLDGEARHR
jgi:hypothetical protein